jgi:hypothetical protein
LITFEQWADPLKFDQFELAAAYILANQPPAHRLGGN